MNELGEQQTTAIDAAALTRAAREASGRPDLRLEDYLVNEISGGLEAGNGLMRIQGTGIAPGEVVAWQVILKTFAVPEGEANPQGHHFWKREAAYYASGLLDQLPGGLRAPRCYESIEKEGQVQLYLEDLQGPANPLKSGMEWQVEDYRAAAACLGRFNAAYLTGRQPIPTAAWIPTNWLRAYVEAAAPNMDFFLRSQHIPVLQRVFAGFPLPLIRKAWEDRNEILALLERLPQTFCHQDAFCRNLFSEQIPSSEQLVAVDWSYGGPAALGSELVPLFCGAHPILGPIPYAQSDRLYALVMEGYLEGLCAGGWQPDEDQVQFAFSATLAYRYPIGALIGEVGPAFADESASPVFEQLFGMPIDQIFEHLVNGMALGGTHYDIAMRLKQKLQARV